MVEKSSRRDERKAPRDKPPREHKEEAKDAVMLEDRDLIIDTSEKIEIV